MIEDPARARAEPFQLDGPLPGSGLTVIEASAGTGKTWTLTSLVVRYVAEGVALSEILAVTFTRLATGELRDRIRRRLSEVHTGLSARLAGAGPGEDALVEVLFAGGREDAERKTRLLAVALADFDAATIATTHGFCQMVLHGLGSAGDSAPEVTLLEDPRDLIRQIADDLYLRGCLHGGPLPFEPVDARRVAIKAVENPGSDIYRYPAGGRSARLAELAVRARVELAERLRSGDTLTYDEMLTRLADTLQDPVRGPEAARRLHGRYRVVLVDEFQDTDPVQWTIVRLAFLAPGSDTRLVLIGDPKQAIYSFRGADVQAYLEAAAMAERTWTLEECRRTDQPLLDGLAALFSPARFGHPRIEFRTVRAATGRRTAGLGVPPLRFRVVDDDQRDIDKTPSKKILQKSSLEEWVARDVAGDIDALLASGRVVPDGTGVARPLGAGDVAVLAHTNKQAAVVQAALRARNIPAVLAGSDNVFGSDAALQWLRLLDLVAEPTSRSRLAVVALGPFVGLTAEEVVSAGEETWVRLHRFAHDWSAVLTGQGVAALYRAVSLGTGVPGRVLGVEGGERVLTDLSHVAELLHREATSGQLGPASLRAWLAARIRTVGEETGVEERSRRLDSDAAAVQVLTVHRSKGLEWGVVYAPFLWEAPSVESTGPIVFHDPATGRRVLDVGSKERSGPEQRAYRDHAALARADQEGESLRLMYVALTRARHGAVVWWGRADKCGTSPLGRLLLCRHPETGDIGPATDSEPKQRLVLAALAAVRSRAGGAVSVEPARIRPVRSAPPTEPDGRPTNLQLARFDRSLDQAWRRSSYSAIAAGSYRAVGQVSSEAEVEGVIDEPADLGREPDDASLAPPGDARSGPAAGTDAVSSAGASDARRSAAAGPGPWSSLPGGTEVGTFVHRVLEVTDFGARDLPAEVAAGVRRAGRLAVPADETVLVDALVGSITTPLGGPLAGAALADIDRKDRLDELSFELPVAGGDRPNGVVGITALADLIGRRLTPDDRLGAYPGRLREPGLAADLRGYLVGSLDLVFRRAGPEGSSQWFVIDYKTNRIGPPGAAQSADLYGPSALAAEMVRHHYPLQALLYSVALHRYLSWRQPDYRPEAHLGGVYYLFLRGMAGPATPVVDGCPCGVFHWPVPTGLVVDLSDLLAGPVRT